jgi:hypothetical protein
MDRSLFDDVVRSLASTSPQTRRTTIRQAALTLCALLGLNLPRRKAAAATCEPPCPLDEICVDGACLSIIADGGCPIGCADGFVCIGDRCVLAGPSKCGLCELPTATGECVFSCQDDEYCAYDVDDKGDWTSWRCRSDVGPDTCHDCDGRYCQSICTEEEFCLDGPGVCRPCTDCGGTATCGAYSTENLCCTRPDWAFCLCESSPGAGDGWAGCCGSKKNPCPSPYQRYLEESAGDVDGGSLALGFGGETFSPNAGAITKDPNSLCRRPHVTITCFGE